jgi:DNA polymerase-4
VAVAPTYSERALIFFVSPEARREGIFKGMALEKAMKFCPDLTVLPPNPGLMEKSCRVLAKVVARYTPIWEPSRPGHVYMDVTGTERLWGRAKDAADRIRREIKDRLYLSGTVGVAGNKMVSSIASRIILSEGVLDVDHGQESSFMAPLGVNLLPGIGHVRRRILLEDLNISLIKEIAAMDMYRLKLVFGGHAYVIHQRALGIDPTPVHPPTIKPTVSEEVTLPRDKNDDREILGTLYGLVERCAQWLRRRGLLPGKAGLAFRYADQAEVIRQINLPHLSFWDFDLYAPLEKLFLKACQRRMGIRFLRVWFRDLSPPTPQLSIFPTVSPVEKKKALVIQALDSIRKKHGDEAIWYGRTA